jgi:hypothetical protein
MVRTQVKLLVAVLAAAGLVAPASAQITFTGGSSYVEATGGIPPFTGANALYQQTLNTPMLAGPNGMAARNGSINALGVSHSSSAALMHTVNSSMAMITGTATANRSGTPTAANTVTGAFGLSAPNNPPQGTTPGAPPGYGYLTNFMIGSPGTYILDVDWNRSATTPAGANNQAYSDFMGYLWDQSRNVVWAVGGFLDNTGGASSTAIGEPDPSTLPAGATVIPLTLDPRTLNLGSGQYTLYLQGQAYAQGASGAQIASTNPSIRLQQVIPEPLSVAVFGGLLAVGGLVARRRLTTKA